ncbi:MAG: right-handed parallel beta-helix repeat-containing protein, partial [Planctomycetes bacterium]|nr:right-handed parallel beta-helix repeat-containing protein [Planctomycetota bacterium]
MWYGRLLSAGLFFLLMTVTVTPAQSQLLEEMTGEVSADLSDIFGIEDDGNLWGSFTAWSFKPGDNRVLGNGELFVPIWQDSESLLFVDMRGQIDDQDSAEGNWGLGFRQIRDNSWILGVYGFYDLLHSANNNNFSQGMFGIEALAVGWEARFNGYIPEGGTRLLPGTSLSPYATVSNSNVVIRSGGAAERAYYGFDAEVGALLRDWNCGDTELRGYVGGFHFDTSDSSFPNISGPRVRLELRAYDVGFLGNGSRVTLGVEAQWDQVRNEQVFAMLRVRVPLGRRTRTLSRLERRMLDRIVRDVDVVANDQGTAVHEEAAIDPATGNALRVIDANSTDVPGIVSGAGANSTVFAVGDAGQINVNAPIVLQNGQIFRNGAGLSMNVEGAETGVILPFTIPGNVAPVVNGTNVAADVFHLANDSTLRDITITGGRNGVSTNGANLTGLTIDGNNVSGAAVDGFNLGNIAANSSVTNNTANNNTEDGFEFINVAGTFTGNTANNNPYGFYFFDVVAGSTFSNNSATGNNQAGFGLSGVLAGATFNGNTANTNTRDGFQFGGDIYGTFTGNTATGNGIWGFNLQEVKSGGMFTNNTATGNGSTGFELYITAGTMTDNTATGNGASGFYFTDISGGTVSNNISNTNSQEGFL